MPTPLLLTPDAEGYPQRLRVLPTPPRVVSVEGVLTSARTVAIVGTRKPTDAARAFARSLAEKVVRAGAVVVSGGALGIDTAAHEGALDGGGATWVVSGTGHGVVYPTENAPLFARVVEAGGAMVWPFPPGTSARARQFIARNGVLVALSDVIVIVQARVPSGALNAALWARRLNRPRWVVCPAPWDSRDPDFAGCQLDRRAGARALTSIEHFLHAVKLPKALQVPLPGVPQVIRNPSESAVLSAMSATPVHVDVLTSRCGLPYADVLTALLTLVLGDVLVEGPEGFFRLVIPP